MIRTPFRALLPLFLLVLGTILAAVGPFWETRQRAPEGIAREYLAAVERGDLNTALEAIDPERREAVRERVALQLGNRYRVETFVLGRPSVVDRLAGRGLPPAWATLFAEVTTVSGDRWRSTSTAPLVERDGRWYLLAPLFA
jgi:hypothetical protein